MLVSAVLQLKALTDGRIPAQAGRAVHSLWFDHWQAIMPTMAAVLHPDHGRKPFTLTPLLGLPRPQRGQIHLRAGQTAEIRITTLHPAVSEPFLERWVTTLPGQIELQGHPWSFNRMGLSPHEHAWAEQTQTAVLLEQAQPRTSWTLKFETPVTFHVGKSAFLPFPLPSSLIRSWSRSWEAFGGPPLPPLTEETLREHLLISHYNLKTIPVRYGQRLHIGAVGRLTLKASSKLPPAMRKAIDALAAFAFFCGSGSHTTQGLGMTIPEGRDPGVR